MSGQFAVREAHELQQANNAGISLTSTGVFNAVNVSGESGVLTQVGIHYIQVIGGAAPTAVLEIQVDGGTTRTIAIFTALTTVSDALQPFRSDEVGAPPDRYMLVLALRYRSSLRVGVNVSVATTVTGLLSVSVIRGRNV